MSKYPISIHTAECGCKILQHPTGNGETRFTVEHCSVSDAATAVMEKLRAYKAALDTQRFGEVGEALSALLDALVELDKGASCFPVWLKAKTAQDKEE